MCEKYQIYSELDFTLFKLQFKVFSTWKREMNNSKNCEFKYEIKTILATVENKHLWEREMTVC